MNYTLLICLATILLSCDSDQSIKSTTVELPKKELTTNAEKRTFLESILAQDQGMRSGNEDSDIMLKYGNNTKEHLAYIKDFMAKDQTLLEQVEWYLDKYGYPSKTALGKDAAMTPWLVIHHCTHIGVRNSHFEMLLQA